MNRLTWSRPARPPARPPALAQLSVTGPIAVRVSSSCVTARDPGLAAAHEADAHLVAYDGDAAQWVQVRERDLWLAASPAPRGCGQQRASERAPAQGAAAGHVYATHIIACGKDDGVTRQLEAVVVHDRVLLELADVGANQERLSRPRPVRRTSPPCRVYREHPPEEDRWRLRGVDAGMYTRTPVLIRGMTSPLTDGCAWPTRNLGWRPYILRST